MADVQVTCVTKPDRNSSHEHITHLGGRTWYWPVQDVITSIENGINTFYTYDGHRRANIKVRERNGRKFVQTRADGEWTDNLLALDACRIS
jgi:Mor family transcriptional regulator